MAKKKRLKQAELEKFGTSPRSYDMISENDDEDSKRKIAGVMRWMVENPKKPYKDTKLLSKMTEGIVSGGFALQDMDGLSAQNVINALSPDLKPKIAKAGSNMLVRLYHNVRDIFARRRVKTALMITGCTLAGAAAGAAIGAAVIPLIGGAPGAVIGAIVGALGGAVGLGIIGGVVGGKLSKLSANRLFKKEKYYQISTKRTQAIKRQYAISNRTFLTMNAYLHNRYKASRSPLCKHHYNTIRKRAVKGNQEAINAMARFFCHELILLHSELNQKSPHAELYKDIDTVKKILEQLQISLLPSDLRSFIGEILKTYKLRNMDLDVIQESVKAAAMTEKPAAKRKSFLADHSSRPEPERLSEMSVDMSDYKDITPDELPETLVLKARQIYRKTKDPNITIIAGGDDKIAIQLMAAALKAGLNPTLDEKEYPKDNELKMQKRLQVIEKAYRLAGKEIPKEVKKVGFRFAKDP